MPALTFTVFVDKILSGEKRQTIRPPRKHPIKVGDKLYLYAHQRTKNCRKLGEAVCSAVVPVEFGRFETEEELKLLGILALAELPIDDICLDLDRDKFAQDDGFNNFAEMELFFITTYKLKPGDSKEMVIIKWRDFKASP